MWSAVLAAAVSLGAPAGVSAASWKPITPEDLARKAPIVDKDADAEALFWDVRISDQLTVNGPETIYEHYARVRIFTDHGRESFATVDIPYAGDTRVLEVAARTIKPDGRIIEVNKSDLHRRVVVKAGGLKLRVLSFAIPNLERLDIVEYRWKEIHPDSVANYLQLPFSREVPVVSANYYVRPLAIPGFGMLAQQYNADLAAPQKQKDGSTLFAMTHVPARKDEPFAPPRLQTDPWILIYYEEAGRMPARQNFWATTAREMDDAYAKEIKIDGAIKAAVAEAAAAPSLDVKVRTLLEVLRARVRRVDVDTATPAERRAAKDNKHAADTFKRGLGTAHDVTVLYAAMARAAGLDARVAAVPDREDILFNDSYANTYFLSGRIVVLKDGDAVRFVEPANRHSPDGGLRWQHEAQRALLAGKEVTWLPTPQSNENGAVKRRVAKLTLLEDGTLEGDMSIIFTGHFGVVFREQEAADTSAEREQAVKDLIGARLPGAEISNVRVEHVDDPQQPYTNKWHVRVPGYANKTGSRLFLQPAAFQRGLSPTLAAATRTRDIYFRFAWTEDDYVTLALPAGFALEAPDAPPPITMPFGTYQVQIGLNDNGRTLVYRRRLVVGKDDHILLKGSAYPAVKEFFDLVDRHDGHALALRKTGAQ